MFLSNLALRRPVFITMIVLALVISGGVSYTKLGENLFPSVSFPIISVTLFDPGSSARIVEERLTLPAEEALSALPGIQHVHSVTVPGAATVTMTFPDNEKPEKLFSEVQEKLQKIRHELPRGLPSPIISRVTPTEMPLLWIVFPFDGGEIGNRDLTWLKENVVPPLRALDGVAVISPIWPPSRVLHIWVRSRSLIRYSLSMETLAGLIRQNSLVLPSGRVSQGDREIMVETSGQALTPESLKQMAVPVSGGKKVILGDLATIREGWETARSIFRLDGNPAVGIQVFKKNEADGRKVSRSVRTMLNTMVWPKEWKEKPIIRMDRSQLVKKNNRELLETLLLGGALTVVVIFLFLESLVPTIIASLSIPASVISTFAVMKFFHFTLNTLTMLGLSLVVGILVDDAIVVLENIVRHRQEGLSASDAARQGVGEIGLAVLATTFSIIAVFAPVAFMQGIFGKFFYEFGLTVSFAVGMSMFVSLTLTPVLASRFLKNEPALKKVKVVSRWLEKLRVWYRNLLEWSLGHPGTVVMSTIGVLALIGLMVPRIGWDLVPRTDQGAYVVQMTAGSSASLNYADRKFKAASEELSQLPGVSSVFYQIGGGPEIPLNQGYLYVSLKPLEHRVITQEQSMAMARTLFAKDLSDHVSVDRISLVGGSGREIPLQVILMGPSRQKLELLSQELADRMKGIRGLVDIETPDRFGQRIMTVRPKKNLPDTFAVTPESLGQSLRMLLDMTDVGILKQKESGEKVLLSIDPEEKNDPERFSRLPVLLGNGKSLPLRQVAIVSEKSETQERVRDDRLPSLEVNANIVGKQTLGKAMESITSWASIHVPVEYRFRFGGSGDVLNQAIGQFTIALLLAILAVYMVLASQFENFLMPFVIMVSIPVSVVGAIFALWVTGNSFNLMSAMGLIILFGLVAKNAILLVDYTNTLRRRGMERRAALMEACPVRLRPVLMTTVAMVAGMLPMAFGWGAGGALRTPMALVVVGGLLSSMALTLIVVPVVYDQLISWYDAMSSH